MAAKAAGKTVKKLLREHGELANVLGGIAEAAPYLWDLVRSKPARFVRLLTHEPEVQLAALLAKARESAAAARTADDVMRILRR